MLSLRVSRDKRGYDHIYLLLEIRRKGRTVTRLLYGGRWPSPMRIGQQPLDEATRRALEQAYPEVTFDWLALQKTLQQALSIPRAAPMGGAPPGDRRMRRGGPPGAGAPGARPGQGGGPRGGPQGPPTSRPPMAARPKPGGPAAYEPPEAALIADIPDAPGVIDIVELDDVAAAEVGPDLDVEVVEQTFVVSVSPTELIAGVPDQEPTPDQQTADRLTDLQQTAFGDDGDDAGDDDDDGEDGGDEAAPAAPAADVASAGAPTSTNAARRRRRRRRRGHHPPQTAAEPFAAGSAEQSGPTEERPRTESAPSAESDRAPDHPDDPPV